MFKTGKILFLAKGLLGDRAFKVYAQKLWNALPKDFYNVSF